jgi:hypothetical protein
MMWPSILVAGVVVACGGGSLDRAPASAPKPSSAAPVAAPGSGAPLAGSAASTTRDTVTTGWRIAVGQVGAIKLGSPLPPDLLDDDLATHYVARYIADGQPVDAFSYDKPALLIILASGPFGTQVEAAHERIPPRSDVSRAEAAELAHEVPVKTIMVRSSGPATDAGAGVGSTLAELQRAYDDLKLSALPETLGGDTCRAHSRSLPGIQFMFSTCNRAKAGATVLRVDVTSPGG